MLTTFIPILLTALVAFALAIVMIVIARFTGPHRPNPRKAEPYECGIIPEKLSPQRFDIRYYAIAILFLAFDVEIIFLFPWAVAFKKLGIFSAIEMLVFFIILLVAYFYALKSGIFDWGTPSGKRIERNDNPWDSMKSGIGGKND